MTSLYAPAVLARSLLENVRSLGVVSQDEAALKRYAADLETCLRDMDEGVVIEEYSGDAFLSLISRLNQEVAPYLLQQGIPESGPSSLRVWVIHQAHLLTTEQQSIIFRLIELFPALPFRAIWLSDQALQAWKEHANTECIFLDLDANDTSEMAPIELWAHSDPLANTVPESEEIATSKAEPAPFEWPANKLSPGLKISVGLLSAGMLGALIWGNFGTSSTPAAEAARLTQTTPAPTTTASAAQPSEATAIKVHETPTQTAEAASKPVPAKVPHADGKALPDAAQAGARWLKALPADTYVVEHGSFGNLEQAQKLKSKHKELTNARIVAVRKLSGTDEWQFNLITGPFRSEDRAKSYVSRLEWKSSTRIRATDKLKTQIAP
ncbi:MAG: hypothetical protein RLZZ464_967 [Pseudomonadota bacterium]